MYDDLSWIERNYGCFTEYNRCREEAEQYEAEKECKRQQWYKKNEARMEEASNNPNVRLVYFSDDCIGCKAYESIGPTHGGGYDIDDVEHGICNEPNRKWYECQYREARITEANNMIEACDRICWWCGIDHIPCDTCPVRKAKERNMEVKKEYE